MGWDGRVLLGQPSRIPHSNWNIIFVLGADEYIERLEGKSREYSFFYIKIFENNSLFKLTNKTRAVWICYVVFILRKYLVRLLSKSKKSY